MPILEVGGRSVELDGEGYLVNFNDWEKDIAQALAIEDKLEMTEDHWTVLQILRDFYKEHQSIPTIRDVTVLMEDIFTNDKANSKFLSQLFPKKPLLQGGRIAGLPRLPGCT